MALRRSDRSAREVDEAVFGNRARAVRERRIAQAKADITKRADATIERMAETSRNQTQVINRLSAALRQKEIKLESVEALVVTVEKRGGGQTGTVSTALLRKAMDLPPLSPPSAEASDE